MRPAASLLVIVTHAMEMFAPSSVFYGAIVLESEASRHIFFFVSALVLMYQAYDRPGWSAGAFWRRRFTSIIVPFVIWTLLYVLAGFGGAAGLEPGVPWPVVVLIAMSGTWIAASLFTAAMTRTPVSRWLVGRARRPLRGGPPPVGRGTVREPDQVMSLSCESPERQLSLFR